MGGLSLVQGLFLTKESNQGLLHCRPILYQLSYQGSPMCLCGVLIYFLLIFLSFALGTQEDGFSSLAFEN